MLYALSNLSKTYGDRTVLDIPRLDIGQGGIYALLGPNGAGKTTLLDILAFLSRPTAGEIRFLTRPVEFSETALHALRRDVVMVNQQPILFTTTVYKNVEFGLKVRKVPPAERRKIVNAALDLVGMGEFSSAMAHRLSGGETQRVALARALAVSPRVLLCDEPTASVDLENQAAVIQILKQINSEKKISIIFTTHDRFQAAALASHTLFLDHGRLAPLGHENIFAAEIAPESTRIARCTLQKTIDLRLPRTQFFNSPGRVRVVIDPEMISLTGAGNGHSGESRFSGRIVHVSQENDTVRVVVDIGLWITLLMPSDRYRQLRPLVGDTVGVAIPPDAVEIV